MKIFINLFVKVDMDSSFILFFQWNFECLKGCCACSNFELSQFFSIHMKTYTLFFFHSYEDTHIFKLKLFVRELNPSFQKNFAPYNPNYLPQTHPKPQPNYPTQKPHLYDNLLG